MPYPVAHALFFLSCICAVAVYATFGSIIRRELSNRAAMQLILLLFVGGLCALFPDITIVYNILVNGTRQHCSFGPVPTHSLLFSISAILFGAFVGYFAYRKFSKAAYMALFAEAAFLSHLMLDDVFRNQVEYLYPLYNKPLSILWMVDVHYIPRLGPVHYLITSVVPFLFICSVIMMALFALNRFGFEFRYRPGK